MPEKITVSIPDPESPEETSRWDALTIQVGEIAGRIAYLESIAHTHEGGPDHALEVAEVAEIVAEIALEEAQEAPEEESEELAEEIAEEFIEELIEELEEAAEEVAEEETADMPMEPVEEEPIKDEPPRQRHWLYKPIYRKG